MDVTLDASQLLILPLEDIAEQNITFMLFTLDMFHLFKSLLNQITVK